MILGDHRELVSVKMASSLGDLCWNDSVETARDGYNTPSIVSIACGL